MRRIVVLVMGIVAVGWPPSSHASVITDSLTRDRLVGSWAEDGDCSQGGLTFNANGTFSVTGDYADADFTGTFDVKDGRLAGEAGAREMPLLPVFFDSNGALILGPDLFERCKTPAPAPVIPSRP